MVINNKQREVDCQETVGVLHDKKGWIKIMEAFISILLIMVVILIIINQGYFSQEEKSKPIFNKQLIILKEIEANRSLRNEVLSATAPLNWNDSSFPPNTKSKIIEKTPANFNCEANLCELDNVCNHLYLPNKEIFAKSIVISANLTTYAPKQLKLFCWEE